MTADFTHLAQETQLKGLVVFIYHQSLDGTYIYRASLYVVE